MWPQNAPQPDLFAPLPRGRRAAILAAAAVSFLAKLLLALTTYGTNDVYTYERFGLWSRYFGADLYTIAPDLNHPPSMLHILRLLLWLAEHTSLPFHFWLRFPGILADLGTLALLCRILRPRLARRSVFTAVLLIALAPIHILISGFHGNTDPVMVFFVMAAVWLAAYRRQAALGGAAFGAALCIKIAPVILIPVLFFALPDVKKRLAFFSASAALVLAAWSPFLFEQPQAVLRQVFGYKSSYGLWGLSWILRELANAWPATAPVNRAFSLWGAPLVLAAILAFSVWMNKALSPRPALYPQIGLVYLLFFAITGGFAVQYLAWLSPWLAEFGALPLAGYLLTGSVFLLVVYNYWNLGMPWYLAVAYPWNSHQYFQALCWISVLLLAFAAWRSLRGAPPLALPALRRVPPALRVAFAAILIGAFLVWPAIRHMRRDSLGISPAYAEDSALFTQADAWHNLAAELYRRGRVPEADAVELRAAALDSRARDVSGQLARLQPVRLDIRTPEDYVDASLDDYNRGDFARCVQDAADSLKHRPGMPAAWNNIALCNAQLGNWDAATAAATQALRLEPESDLVRQNLDWVLYAARLARAR